jgi:hypothetical protein
VKKNIINKILIPTILIFGMLNIGITNAWEFDELNDLLNIEEEFSCASINKEIKNYPVYEWKIDNLFNIISKKDETIKSKYFTKIDDITKKYLDKLDRVKQKKLYTIIGYLKCENDDKLRMLDNYNWTMIMKKWIFVSKDENGFEIRKMWLNFYIYYNEREIIEYKTKKLEDWTLFKIEQYSEYEFLIIKNNQYNENKYWLINTWTGNWTEVINIDMYKPQKSDNTIYSSDNMGWLFDFKIYNLKLSRKIKIEVKDKDRHPALWTKISNINEKDNKIFFTIHSTEENNYNFDIEFYYNLENNILYYKKDNRWTISKSTTFTEENLNKISY